MAFQNNSETMRLWAKRRQAEQRATFRTVTTHKAVESCFCYVAFADGTPTSAEVRWVQSYTVCDPKSRRTATQSVAISLYPASLSTVQRALRAYVSAVRPSLLSRKRLLRDLKTFALCDGPVSAAEADVLQQIAELLQLSVTSRTRRSFDSQRRNATAQARGSGRTARREGKAQRSKVTHPTPNQPTTPHCYQVLGCTESDTDETIKRAYRRLAAMLHPDKYAARAQSGDEMLPHIRAFQELQAAYEEIQRRRKD